MAGYALAQQTIVQEQPNSAIEQPADQTPGTGQTDRLNSPRRESTANFRGNSANAGGQHSEVQRYVAGCLLAKNQAEVELGKFAQQQAESPQVKEFAQMMVQDHGKLIQQLQQVAGNQSGAQPTADNAERTRPQANRDLAGQNAAEATAANRANGANSAVDQLLAMEKQIVERCTQSAKEELQQKQGVEFDKCYMGSQIGGHMQMLAALEVIQQQGPEPLQKLAQQAQPQVQKHLDQAKQIMQQLEGAGTTGARAARQPTSQPKR
jgi:predicted outer membrane protein